MDLRLTRAALAATLALAATGCSMSTQWWVHKSLQRSGFTNAQARCATSGVMGALTPEQLQSLYQAIALAERPDRFAGSSELLNWLSGRVEQPILDVVAHYATHCQRSG